MPIILGSQPTLCHAINRDRGVSLWVLTACSLATMREAAPSHIPIHIYVQYNMYMSIHEC